MPTSNSWKIATRPYLTKYFIKYSEFLHSFEIFKKSFLQYLRCVSWSHWGSWQPSPATVLLLLQTRTAGQLSGWYSPPEVENILNRFAVIQLMSSQFHTPAFCQNVGQWPPPPGRTRTVLPSPQGCRCKKYPSRTDSWCQNRYAHKILSLEQISWKFCVHIFTTDTPPEGWVRAQKNTHNFLHYIWELFTKENIYWQ